MSILLEVLGRGLEGELRELLRPVYWPDESVSLEFLRQPNDPACLPEKIFLHGGFVHWRNGELNEAAAAFRHVVSQQPQNAQGRAALVCVLTELRDWTNALKQLRCLNRIILDSAEVQFCIGYCYERIGQPVSAAVHYRRAIQLAPDTSRRARLRLAAIGLNTNRLDESIEQYERVSEHWVENVSIKSDLGCMYFLTQEYDKAQELFETVIALEPDNWSLNDETVNQYILQGRQRKAIDYVKEQIEDQGPFADLYLQLGNLYSMVGDDDPAVRAFMQALDIQPGYLEVLVKLATHHLLFGRWDQSAELFGQAADVNDRLVLNYIGMGVSQAASGDLEDSTNSFHYAASIEPNSTLLHAQMIRLHWKLAMRGEGYCVDDEGDGAQPLRNELQCHADRVQCSPNDPQAHFHYGVLLRSTGQFPEATREFLQSILLHPTHLHALAKVGVLLKEQQRQEQAARAFHRVLEINPEQLEYHYRLALAYYQPGGIDAFAEELMKVDQFQRDIDGCRQSLRVSLVDMGLLDRGADSWQSLRLAHRIHT